MEGKTGMNSQQGKNCIIEYFMLLKIFHQPFAYDLCCVVFCLRKVSRDYISPKCACPEAMASVNTTERNILGFMLI